MATNLSLWDNVLAITQPTGIAQPRQEGVALAAEQPAHNLSAQTVHVRLLLLASARHSETVVHNTDIAVPLRITVERVVKRSEAHAECPVQVQVRL
jgi:hypothetical protein